MPLFGKKNKSVKYTEQSFARLEQTDGEGNNALHLACEVNDWEKMMTILAESYKQPAKLKALLLQKNADGQTPIDLAIDAAGDSDTGESHLKLLLSAYVRKLDMLPEMFAEPKDGSEESGIWKRPGFSLPALGGLLTANDQGVLMSKGDKGEELLDANDYPEFLNEYAELPHEAIGLVVAVAFLKEWNEKITWMGKRGRGKWIEGTKPWKAIGGMYTKPSRLGAVFYKLVELAKDAQEAAEAAEDDYRTTEAIKFRELSDRLQSAIATCFDYMGNNVAFAVCCSGEEGAQQGDAALSLACQSGLNTLLASSSMRGATLRKWRGKRLQVLLDRKDDDFHDWYMNALKLSWFILLNSLLIVPAAICPPLARYRSWGFGSMFPDGGYLLQTAFFQSAIFMACDINLTIALTFAHYEDAGAGWVWGSFWWAVAALYYELQQIWTRKTKKGASFIDMFRTYLNADMFNVLDLAALTCAVVALFFSCAKRLLSTGGRGAEWLPAALDTENVDYYFETVGSVAVLLMWVRQLRTLMIVSGDMAPLVRMMKGMLNDVFKFILLLLLVLFGFAGALSTLFIGEAFVGGHDAVCDSIIGTDANFWSTLKLLFEGSLLAESPFIACVEGSNHGTVGLLFVYGFMLVSVVLLLNMIIAMMGKTFDRYWERAQEEAAAGFASMVQDWEGQQDMPAPLNLLSFPYFVIKTVMWGPFAKLRSWCEDGSPAGYKKHEDSKKVIGSGEKTLRLLTLGDKPGGLADLEELKDMIADNLNEKFGQHEDTGTLIDNAVKTLDEKIDELQTDLLRALEKQTKTIEARFAAMPARK